MPGGKIVATVEYHVGAGNQFVEHLTGSAGFERDYCHVRVVLGDGLATGPSLGQTHGRNAMQDLSLQIGQIDAVAVDQGDASDSGGGQVQRGRRSQSTGADQQRMTGEQSLLPFDTDLWQQNVARVAQQLVIVHVRE